MRKPTGSILNVILSCTVLFFGTAMGADKQQIGTKLSSMSSEQRQALRDELRSKLTDEQKAKLKERLIEKYSELSEEEKEHIKNQLGGFIEAHPQVMRASADKLNESDRQRIVQQILQQIDKKLRAMPSTQRNELYIELKDATTPQQRLRLLSLAIGRIGNVTYGISGGDILTALNDMSLEELATLFGNLATAINDSIYSDTMLGSDLYQLFSGLSDVIDNAADNIGDATSDKYIPLLMRTPHAAKCRSSEATSSGESIECDVSERNVFWVSSPYAAGQIVGDQTLYINLTCADDWTIQGEYCSHPSIPGLGVKAEILFDGNVISSGGEEYYLVWEDHFNVEDLSGKPEGDGDIAIDDNDKGCNLDTNNCKLGDGLYHTSGAALDGHLSVSVTWAMLNPELYDKPTLSDEALNNLHPFSVEYRANHESGIGAQEMKDQGVKNMFIVTNFQTISTSCVVTQPEQTIDLGTVWAGNADSGVVESSLKPFEIGLSCTGTQTDYKPIIRIATAAETGIDNTTQGDIGFIKNEYIGVNAAANVGVMLFQDLPSGRVAIPAFNSTTSYGTTFDLSTNSNPILKFLAGFYKPSMLGELTAGKFEASITVELTYL
ncbi:fimbrial protein [Vibrio natriegens]|uniref:fimbrial protein n=1 Tax=Vibrio natriegens TaxID=691 RepID=UPI00355862FF